MMPIFRELGTALITPFHKQTLKIDFESLERLLQGQLDNKVDFVVVMGTTGEAPSLSWEEKLEVLHFVIDKCGGKIQIMFGLGGNNTHELTHMLPLIPQGVDGILSVSPYYNKPSQKGVFAHYQHLAQSTHLPIVLYNVPGRTGSNILPETTLKLAEIKNIVGIKEASGNMEQIMEIIAKKSDDFDVLSGDDALTLPLIASGAQGLISVMSNAYPKQMGELVRLAREEKMTAARSIHNKMLEAIHLIFEQGSPAGIKALLQEQGMIQSDAVRLPLAGISDELRLKIKNIYQQFSEKKWQ